MSYLERLKTISLEEIASEGTAKTVKKPFGSFGSNQSSHFQKIEILQDRALISDEDDDRRYCLECSNLVVSRCLAAWRGEIEASRHYRPIDDLPRRCMGYMPAANDPDQRSGRQHWPGLARTSFEGGK